MSGADPKRHHYVPEFHLARFANANEQVWVWNKDTDATFLTSISNIGSETHFYKQTELTEQGHDPLTMEKQFSHIEGETKMITNDWLEWLRECDPLEKIPIPKINRQIVSQYMAVQFLRTADQRDILSVFVRRAENEAKPSEDAVRRAHTALLWDLGIINELSNQISRSIWTFGRNRTTKPFLTSDNPVTFKTSDNLAWLKAGVIGKDTYVTFPLAPDIVMYCYQRRDPFRQLYKLDATLSPVEFTPELVESDNTGQVAMAGKFVISSTNDFAAAREFLKYARAEGYRATDDYLDGKLPRRKR